MVQEFLLSQLKLKHKLCVIHLEVYLRVVTFGVQLGSVLGETLEADLLPQQVEELFQGGAGCLVVVHFLLCALPRSAVHHAHLHLKTQLDTRQFHFCEISSGRSSLLEDTQFISVISKQLLSSHPLFIQLHQLLSDFGSVEGQPEAGQIQFW